MPKSPAPSPAAPAAARQSRYRPRGRTRPVGRGARVAPCRCPHCHGDLSPLAPMLVTSVTVLEIVARLNLDQRLATSALIGEHLSTTQHETDAALRNAVRDGLLTRTRESRRIVGGFLWRYQVTPLAIAYVRSPGLARQLSRYFQVSVSSPPLQDTATPPTPPTSSPARPGRQPQGRRLGGTGL